MDTAESASDLSEQVAHIRSQARKSVKWALLGDFLRKAIQPLVVVILARLLTPDDYGIIGMAMLVIALARMLEGMGLSQALIQTDCDVRMAADAVFWSNLGLSGLLYCVVFLAAPLVAAFFDEPRLTIVLRVMGLQLVLSAFDDVQEALLRRDFRFKQLVGRRVLPALMPGVVGIPLAMAGFGYWSLVAGSLSGTALGVALLWKVSRWRPRFRFDRKTARLLWVFGALVALESLQGWALNQGDRLVVGHFLGTETLGRYFLGFNLILLIMGLGIGPLSGVAYSAFCRLQTQTLQLQQSFVDSTRMLAVVVIPVSLGLCVTAPLIVPVVLGGKWGGLEPVIRILALMPGLSWIIGLYPLIYRAIGRPDIMPKFHVAQMLYIVPVYLIGVRFGLVGFCLARASVGVVFYFPHIWLSVRLLKLPRSYFWHCIRSPLFAGLAMGAAVLGLVHCWGPDHQSVWQGWLHLAAVLAGGAFSYVLALWLIDRSLCLRFVQIARKLA